jgi:hypothetical protein
LTAGITDTSISISGLILTGRDMKAICGFFDKIHAPVVFEKIWHLLTSVSVLAASESAAVSSVFGANAIRYDKVRVAEGRILWIVFKLNNDRAFTLFHTINFPGKRGHSRDEPDIVVHELVHVFQFEKIGSLYIPQSLQAQMQEGYDYGGWTQLVQDWLDGRHFRDFNREQQAQIAQDYYKLVSLISLPLDDPVSLAYQPFIDELRNGEL